MQDCSGCYSTGWLHWIESLCLFSRYCTVWLPSVLKLVRGKNFSSDDKAVTTVVNYLTDLNWESFCKGIQSLHDRWQRVVAAWRSIHSINTILVYPRFNSIWVARTFRTTEYFVLKDHGKFYSVYCLQLDFNWRSRRIWIISHLFDINFYRYYSIYLIDSRYLNHVIVCFFEIRTVNNVDTHVLNEMYHKSESITTIEVQPWQGAHNVWCIILLYNNKLRPSRCWQSGLIIAYTQSWTKVMQLGHNYLFEGLFAWNSYRNWNSMISDRKREVEFYLVV